MDSTKNNSDFSYGGEMGELIRAKDWSATSLGKPENWPQSLRTALSIILHSKFPMFLWWGIDDLVCFYNDAYRSSLGENGKHPNILGMKAEEAWPEIWDTIKPLIDVVLRGGESTWNEDQLIPIYRNGKIEDVYWTYCYSAVNDETGKAAGVFVTCNETTEKVKNEKLLKESNDQLFFAIDATELGTWDFNAATNKFSGNTRFKEWFGLGTKEDIELSLALAVIIEADRQKVTEAIQYAQQYESGGNYDIQYTIHNPSTGKERIVNAKGKAWFNENKICYRFNGTLQDVTTQVLANRKIQESEKRFRLMAEGTAVLISMSDESGKATYFNQACADLSGKSVEELLDFGWTDIIHPDDKGIIDTMFDAFKNQQSWEGEFRMRDKNNNYRWLLVKRNLRQRGDGMFGGYITASIDITERKLSEEAVKQFKFMADNARDPFILIRKDGTFAYLNDLALKKWGYTHAEAENLLVTDIDAVIDKERFDTVFARAQTETIQHFDTIHKKKDGTTFDVEINMGALTISNEPYLFAVARDITERKQLEKQKDDFLSIASHELKTPVTTIKAYGQIAESILEQKNDVEALLMVKKMGSQVNKLTTLIEDLLDITKIQKGKLLYKEALFDFNELVKEAIDDMQKTSIDHVIKCKLDATAKIYGDKNKIGQVLNNLFSNAIKYSPGTNKIVVTTQLKKLGVKFTVQDFGIGISKDGQKHVFEQFYRVNGDNQSTFPGMGIGLYICSEIVKNHKGKIWVESAKGEGSTFHVWLPFDHRAENMESLPQIDPKNKKTS